MPVEQKRHHEVRMTGREDMSVTGVKQLERFDQDEFLIETVEGELSVKGNGLKLVNLDLDKGVVSLKGKVDHVLYLDSVSKEASKGLLGKLFK
ncbi:sporulation protein YabP [Jeotgalibacillus terrae]|uniref:Sporulation protein YabP n=1 Tax=Jeotgalibacillus terrae TaxID=587735 RepID=A0ABW5ZNN6_9BACL|nr:sporulation protein YabP [Jeotgalibacillus terrae]MBM7580658.1 sporulation protein YabP [Jeotgalibacillus terrae]